MFRAATLALPALLLALGPAVAQPLRTAVVPADAAVVIPPRGQPAPRPAALPRATTPPAPPPAAAVPLAAAPMGLAAAPLAILPLAAAALLGGALPGSGGGSSAPATTR
jgi:hypothetical protein